MLTFMPGYFIVISIVMHFIFLCFILDTMVGRQMNQTMILEIKIVLASGRTEGLTDTDVGTMTPVHWTDI